MKLKRRPKTPKDDGDRFNNAYKRLAYQLFGQRMERKRRDLLIEKLKKANVGMTPGQYLSVLIMNGLLAAALSSLVAVLLFALVLALVDWWLFALILVGISTSVALVSLPIMVSNSISARRSKVDRELPFSLSELSILASTGLSPIDVFRRMAARCKDEAMAAEFKKVIYKTDMEGKDLITALGETARETPSDVLRETFWDLANMIHQGGSLDDYLRTKADEVMSLKRNIQEEFISKLTGISDIYVSLVLIGVLFIGIAAFLINALGSSFGGLDANTLLMLLTYLLLPVVIAAFSLVVMSSYSKTE
jgi:flagellar protein FlaJ